VHALNGPIAARSVWSAAGCTLRPLTTLLTLSLSLCVCLSVRPSVCLCLCVAAAAAAAAAAARETSAVAVRARPALLQCVFYDPLNNVIAYTLSTERHTE